MHYYKFNISTFYLSAGHLTAEESGIYRMLIDFYYETESPIEEKALSVIRKRGLKGKESVVMEILNGRRRERSEKSKKNKRRKSVICD